MARTPSLKPGPAQIARAALAMIEGIMKGEPLDEEIADVMADAVWDAYAAGRESMTKRKQKRESSPQTTPAPGECVDGPKCCHDECREERYFRAGQRKPAPEGLYDPCWRCHWFRGAASRECDIRLVRVGPGEQCSDVRPIAPTAPPTTPAPEGTEDDAACYCGKPWCPGYAGHPDPVSTAPGKEEP